jgi:hypothetical protein
MKLEPGAAMRALLILSSMLLATHAFASPGSIRPCAESEYDAERMNEIDDGQTIEIKNLAGKQVGLLSLSDDGKEMVTLSLCGANGRSFYVDGKVADLVSSLKLGKKGFWSNNDETDLSGDAVTIGYTATTADVRLDLEHKWSGGDEADADYGNFKDSVFLTIPYVKATHVSPSTEGKREILCTTKFFNSGDLRIEIKAGLSSANAMTGLSLKIEGEPTFEGANLKGDLHKGTKYKGMLSFGVGEKATPDATFGDLNLRLLLPESTFGMEKDARFHGVLTEQASDGGSYNRLLCKVTK